MVHILATGYFRRPEKIQHFRYGLQVGGTLQNKTAILLILLEVDRPANLLN